MASVVVFIARVIGPACTVGSFAELEAISSDSVARLAERACTKFSRWKVAADEVELFLVKAGGDEEPTADSIEGALSGARLQAGQKLDRACIGPGSWLLARVLPPPVVASATAVGGFSSDLLSLLPVVIHALRLEAARPSVDVRLWSRPGVFSAKLDDDFGIFFSGVAAAARIAAANARLYFFRGAVILDKRIPINDSAALRDFAATHVAVWVFDGGPVSPDVQPADDSVSESAALTRSSGRSASQPAFRDAVLRRDGNSCVLCRTVDVAGAKSCLEATHVIAARSPQAICDSVSLYNVYDSNNGITLCSDCHYWFDRYMWCLLPCGTVSVADALSTRAGCERWVGLCGCTLRAPTEPLPRASWPPPHYWGVQERLFKAAAAVRHEIASGRIYSCEKCGARFENVPQLQQHKKCIMGRHIFTPIFARAFPDAAATA